MCRCLGLTLWSEKYDDYQLKQIGQDADQRNKKNTRCFGHKYFGRQKPGNKSVAG